MSLQVTFDIFSGRPNPVVSLEGADAEGFLKLLQSTASLQSKDIMRPVESMLGYRGMVIEQAGAALKGGLPARFRVTGDMLFAGNAASRVAQSDIEDYIFEHVARSKEPVLPVELVTVLRDDRKLRGSTKGIASSGPTLEQAPAPAKCACGPLYEPQWWNDDDERRRRNNCYNYACNYRTDTFAQPGRASGSRTEVSCAGVRPHALNDALLDDTRPPSKGIHCPEEGILVALVIWPRWDYHWYRLDRDGYWTHKPGSTPVTNLDNSGNRITDPRKADRGRYVDFCGFMIAKHGHVKIS